MTQSEIVAGLDIGSTKIACIVGRKNEYGKVEILGLGRSDSLGVNRGVVENIQNTVDSINKAVAEASHNSGVDIKVVNVGIAGQHIRSLQHRGSIMRNSIDDEIEQDDVSNLIENMYKLVLPPGEEIIHVIPQEYIIDNQQRTRIPIGMSGILLEANFHIITGQVAAAKNIEKCVKKAGLEISSMILEPLASAEAVLSSEEKEAGVALVDIGGGTTDIAIFQDDIIRHTAVIPLGGNVITDDVKEGCSIIRSQAEELKKRFGSSLASENKDEEVVSIPGLKGRSAKEISLKNLAHIIQARMEEIIEHVLYEIKNSGFEKKLIAGIVLTGGGSQLRHAAQLTEFITGMDTRIGYPNEHLAKSLSGETGSPMHATGIGLVIKGLDNKEFLKKRQTSKISKPGIGSGFFSRLFNQGIDFFEKDQSV
ncbi:MAG: cell division protein FtsA [Bacteroides sp.]|jgi:cell division protein FtsA|nr:cell division protein FtsA [Bacteroides sp.]